MKKKISLYLAIVLVFNLLVPFAAPVQVYAAANPVSSIPQLIIEPPQNYLVPGGTSAIPSKRSNGESLSNTATVYWDYATDGEDLYVLRFYNPTTGEKIELTTQAVYDAAGNNNLMVNYDVYQPRSASGPNDSNLNNERYLNYDYPTGGDDGAASNLTARPLRYSIYAPSNSGGGFAYTSIRDYFANLPDDVSQSNRVNNRDKYTSDSALGAPANGWTDETVHTDYYNSALISKPANDLPYILEEDGGKYLDRLAPSFTIPLNIRGGYSFRYKGQDIHFLYEPGGTGTSGRFTFTTNGIQEGYIYDFQLEHYSNSAGYSIAKDYNPHVTNNTEGLTDAGNGLYKNGNDLVYTNYLFTRVRNFNVIPVSQNADATISTVPNKVEHTLKQFLDKEPASGSSFRPAYNTANLEIMSTFNDGTDLLPGSAPTGMDIRFDLPFMYNDETEKYDEVIGETAATSNIPINMSIGFLNSNDGTKSFQVELRNAQKLNELTTTASGIAGGLNPEKRPAVASSMPSDEVYWYLNPESTPFDMTDASRLRDANNKLNRVRIKVESSETNMYGLLFSDVSFDIHQTAMDGNNAVVSTRSANYGLQSGYPVYTFPNFDFDYDEDRLVVTVPPFNYNNITRVGEEGYYYLLVEQGGRVQSIGAYSDGTENKLLELFSPPRDMYFQIIFSRNPIDASMTIAQLWASGSVYFSQYVHYGPPPIITPAISTPNNFEIIDTGTYAYKLTPVKDAPVPAYEADLTFQLRWDIGLDANIEELVNDNDEITVKYNLDYSFIPDKDKPLGEPPYDVITMQIKKDPASTTSPSALMVKYSDSLGVINSAVLPDTDGDGWVPLNKRPSNPQTVVPTNVYYADIPFKTSAVSPYSGKTAAFTYPNLYFMRVEASKMWASSIAEPAEPNLRNLAISNFDSMTLDSISQLAVPAPMNFNVTKNTEDGKHTLDVSYAIPGRAITTYLNSLYSFDPKITVNVYIGQFEEAIREEFYRETYPAPGDVSGAREEIVARRHTNSLELPYYAEVTSAPSLDFITLRGTGGVEPLQVLRGNDANFKTGVVRIAEIPMPAQNTTVPNQNVTPSQVSGYIKNGDMPVNFKITGLDENQRYYLFADLTIEQYSSGSALTGTNTKASSDLTTMDAEITDGTGEEPLPQDSAPPAPENLTAVLDPVLPQSASIVSWDPVVSTSGSADVESKIEYEVIRIESGEMPESKLLPTLPDDINFENFFKTFDSDAPLNKVGWATNGDSATMYDKNFAVVPNDGEVSFSYDPTQERITVNDKTLSSNKIYAYYVRTVKILTVHNDPQLGDYPMRLVSSWNRVFVTTSPIKAPYDLQNPLEHPSYPNLDGMREAMLSWMYPGDIMSQVMSGSLVFYYEIREGENEFSAPKAIPTAQWNDTAMYEKYDDGTMKFFYKLDGLEPDKIYTVHVYLHDTAMGDKSPNTNDVPILTAPDPSSYEDEKEKEKWLDYLNEILQKLLADPYWILSSGPYELTLVVRPGEMFNGSLYGSGLAADIYNTGVDNVTVYIPSGVIEAVNNNSRGLRLPYDDMDILMSPGMISETYNDAIINMETAMHRDEISDYFVRMTVNRSVLNEQIENMPPLSKQANINFTAIGTVNTYKDSTGRDITFKDIETWDKSIFDTAAKLVASKAEDQKIIDRLMEEINKGHLTEEMMAYVESLAAEIEAELLQSITRQVQVNSNYAPTGILSGTAQSQVTELNSPMYIVSKPGADSTYVSGYKNDNGYWTPQPITEQQNGQAITATTPGAYVLAGRAVNIPGIENVARGGHISEFTAKYGLEDYLGYDGVDLNQNATRQMVAGCVARIAGAPKTADPMAWVSSNLNVSMSSGVSSGLVQSQEAVAMLMALYENKTGTSISNMTIRNYQASAGLSNLNGKYAQAVRAAYETGILSGAGFNPSGPVTINQLLEMLGALNGKVKL